MNGSVINADIGIRRLFALATRFRRNADNTVSFAFPIKNLRKVIGLSLAPVPKDIAAPAADARDLGAFRAGGGEMTNDKRHPTFSLIYGGEYKTFVALEAYEEIAAENDKLIRLLGGEEVELQCKKPGHHAVIRLEDDTAIVTDSYFKKESE